MNTNLVSVKVFLSMTLAMAVLFCLGGCKKDSGPAKPSDTPKPAKEEKSVESVTPELVVQCAHQDQVRGMAFTPDGKVLATASLDQTVKLWDLSAGRLIRDLVGHEGGVYTVAVSPDGRMLASAGLDQKILFWSMVDGSLLGSVDGHSDSINSLAFSPDGKYLSSAGSDNSIKLWDAATRVQVRVMEGHTQNVYSVSFSPDGKTLASAGGDKTIMLWDVSTGALIRTVEGHSKYIDSVAFDPTGKTLASASGDQSIRLWDIATGELVRTLGENEDKFYDLSFSPDGKSLAAAGSDRLWLLDPSTGEIIHKFHPFNLISNCVAFSPDGKYLVVGGADHSVIVFDLETRKEILTFEEKENRRILVLAVDQAGKYLAVGSWNDRISFWSLGTGKQVKSIDTDYLTNIAYTPGFEYFAAGNMQTTKLWDFNTGEVVKTFEEDYDTIIGISSVALSPDGKSLAVGTHSKRMHIYDIERGALVAICEDSSRNYVKIAISPDSKLLASIMNDFNNQFRVWDYRGAELKHNLSGHRHSVWAVAFHPDNKVMASGSRDRRVKLWDVETGALIQTLDRPDAKTDDFENGEQVIEIAFSPDGKLLAAGRASGEVNLWSRTPAGEPAVWKLERVVKAHRFPVKHLFFTPDSRVLMTGVDEGIVKFWQAGTGKLSGTLVIKDNDNWLVFTEDGLIEVSGRAQDYIGWTVGTDTFPANKFWDRYHKPGLMAQIFKEK